MGARIAKYEQIRARMALDARMSLTVTQQEKESLDDWGASAGFPTRSDALRFLLKKGMEAVGNENLSGTVEVGQI